MTKELMPWAQKASDEFDREYGTRGCTCFISPPCGRCTHEGNPCNLDETQEAWGELHEVMALEAIENLAVFIEALAKKHLAEMLIAWEVGTP